MGASDYTEVDAVLAKTLKKTVHFSQEKFEMNVMTLNMKDL